MSKTLIATPEFDGEEEKQKMYDYIDSEDFKKKLAEIRKKMGSEVK